MASGILVGLQFLFTYTPPLQHLFRTRSMVGILAMTLFIFLAVEAEKSLLLHLGIHRM